MGHIHEKIDFTVGGVIAYNRKVLMIKHKKLKMWLIPGGHIELDEDPNQALFRELEEETGLKKNDLEILASKPEIDAKGVKFLYTPNYLDVHDYSGNHQHIGFVYFLKSKTDKISLADKEHDGIRWFSSEDIDDPQYNLIDSVKFYAKQALKEFSM